MLLLAKFNNQNGTTQNDYCLKRCLGERLFGNKGMETTEPANMYIIISFIICNIHLILLG